MQCSLVFSAMLLWKLERGSEENLTQSPSQLMSWRQWQQSFFPLWCPQRPGFEPEERLNVTTTCSKSTEFEKSTQLPRFSHWPAHPLSIQLPVKKSSSEMWGLKGGIRTNQRTWPGFCKTSITFVGSHFVGIFSCDNSEWISQDNPDEHGWLPGSQT